MFGSYAAPIPDEYRVPSEEELEADAEEQEYRAIRPWLLLEAMHEADAGVPF